MCAAPLFAAAVADATPGGRLLLLGIRDRLFTVPLADGAFLHAPLATHSRAVFLRDTQDEIERFKIELQRTDPYVAGRIELARSGTDQDKAKSILLLLGGGMDKGVCGLRSPLAQRISEARDGKGCCSDYSHAFLALSEAAGLEARELSNARHTIVEFYDHATGRWIFADPMFGLMADDGRQPLSATEIGEAARRGRPFYMRHVSELALTPKALGEIQRFYAPDAWHHLAFAMGNNVVEWVRLTRQLRMLPRPVAQLITYVVGVRPGYESLEFDAI